MRATIALAALLCLGGCGLDATILAASITSAGSITVAGITLYGEENPPAAKPAEKTEDGGAK